MINVYHDDQYILIYDYTVLTFKYLLVHQLQKRNLTKDTRLNTNKRLVGIQFNVNPKVLLVGYPRKKVILPMTKSRFTKGMILRSNCSSR